MTRLLTVGTVHFQARVAPAQLAKLQEIARAGNVPWHEAIQVIEDRLIVACRAAAAAELSKLASDEWYERP